MSHPVIIIGAGPTGLAAAAHAQSRGLTALILEAGDGAGAAVREWGHVRLFSSWAELVDPAAAKLLADAGWQPPRPGDYPTGAQWIESYLQPLADALDGTEEVTVSYGNRVTGVARAGRDVLVDAGRDSEPFVVHVTGADGPQRLLASAVIDASGTWGNPNPLGTDGYPALGETEHADRVNYAIPDFTDPGTAARYAGKHVAVAGTGASAQNTLLGLARLADQHPGTRISWLVRRAELGNSLGGGDDDQLAQRGALGKQARQVAEADLVSLRTSFRTVAVHDGEDGLLRLESADGQVVEDVDEVVVVTGFRPDLGILSEVRLDLDAVLQAPRQLAPLIDPNHHSCGSVVPHGARELEQPERGFFLAGMKSYGRAPSFLTLTGFEQTRSIVAAIAGDHDAAARVELVLPETGVCGGAGGFDSGSCDIGAAEGVEAEVATVLEVTGGGCCGSTASSSEDLLTIGPATHA